MENTRNIRRKRVGRVVSNHADKTITLLITRRVKHPLYGKYINRQSKIMGDDPENRCKIGDLVEVMECRPLSKRKRWRLLNIINQP